MTHTADNTDDRVRSTACAFGHHRYCRHADDYCTCECHDEPATADNTDRQETADVR